MKLPRPMLVVGVSVEVDTEDVQALCDAITAADDELNHEGEETWQDNFTLETHRKRRSNS